MFYCNRATASSGQALVLRLRIRNCVMIGRDYCPRQEGRCPVQGLICKADGSSVQAEAVFRQRCSADSEHQPTFSKAPRSIGCGQESDLRHSPRHMEKASWLCKWFPQLISRGPCTRTLCLLPPGPGLSWGPLISQLISMTPCFLDARDHPVRPFELSEEALIRVH